MNPSAKQHAMELPSPKGNSKLVPLGQGASTITFTTAPVTQSGDGFMDKLARKIHNFNKGY